MISRTIRPRFVPILQVLVLALIAFGAATPFEARGQDANITVALVGQALIKSDVCATAPAAFEQARGYLKGVDVAFTNLEVAIAPPGEKLTPRSPAAVPAPPLVIDCLKSMGFNVLSLANNHAFDLQREGVAATIGEVRKRGLVHAGTGADADVAAAAGFLATPKGKVALVAMATGANSSTPRPGLRRAVRGSTTSSGCLMAGPIHSTRTGFSTLCGRPPGTRSS
jgi:poly-gamma-glutamate synthesis protein (capsule biosynthesis protein)